MQLEKGTNFLYLDLIVALVLIFLGIRTIWKRETFIGFSNIPLYSQKVKGGVAIFIGILWIVLGLAVLIKGVIANFEFLA